MLDLLRHWSLFAVGSFFWQNIIESFVRTRNEYGSPSPSFIISKNLNQRWPWAIIEITRTNSSKFCVLQNRWLMWVCILFVCLFICFYYYFSLQIALLMLILIWAHKNVVRELHTNCFANTYTHTWKENNRNRNHNRRLAGGREKTEQITMQGKKQPAISLIAS